MKPYETGICDECGKKKKDHFSAHKTLFCTIPYRLEMQFLDSGTAHLCSEKVAAGMLEALQKIRDEYDVYYNDNIRERIFVIVDKAINEALKRGDSRS